MALAASSPLGSLLETLDALSKCTLLRSVMVVRDDLITLLAVSKTMTINPMVSNDILLCLCTKVSAGEGRTFWSIDLLTTVEGLMVQKMCRVEDAIWPVNVLSSKQIAEMLEQMADEW